MTKQDALQLAREEAKKAIQGQATKKGVSSEEQQARHVYVNNLEVSGFIAGNDPELQRTVNGKEIIRFRIGIWQPGVKDKDGKDVLMWLGVFMWVNEGGENQNTELAARILNMSQKDKVIVTGRLVCKEYIDKNGTKRQSWEVSARDVELDPLG